MAPRGGIAFVEERGHLGFPVSGSESTHNFFEKPEQTAVPG
jgi:hypothetical protein